MSNPLTGWLGRLRGAIHREDQTASDGDLLRRYIAHRDGSAFAALVERHGLMVYGVCRHVLSDSTAAEDAFQAAFFVLAQKPEVVSPPERIGAWLHGVAVRVALKARENRERRSQREYRWALQTQHSERNQAATAEINDIRTVVDETLDRVPAKYRSAIVLCDLEGQSRAVAAAELGLSEGTLSSRLARGRRLLAQALTRRGVTAPAAVFAVMWSGAKASAVPPALVASTLENAALCAGGALPATPAAGAAVLLAQQVLRGQAIGKAVATASALLASVVFAGGLLAWTAAYWLRPDQPDSPARAAPTLRQKYILNHPAPVTALAFGPDFLVTGDRDGSLILWDERTGEKREILADATDGRPRIPVRWLGVEADGKRIQIVHGPDGMAQCDVAPKGRRFNGSAVPASTMLGASPDAKWCLWSRARSKALVFAENTFSANIIPRSMFPETPLPADAVAMSFAADSSWVAVVTQDDRIHGIDTLTRTIRWTAAAADLSPTALAVAPDGQSVAIGGRNGSVRLLAGPTGYETLTFAAHPLPVTSVAWSPDGARLLTASEDYTVVVWQSSTGLRLAECAGHVAEVRCLAVSRDGTRAASGSDDRTVRIWELSD